MTAPLDDVEADGAAAAEVFAILGNETRMEVLRTLWESEGPSSFAELRDAVAPDDTGNFNYHLGRLTDHFVRKVDGGYALRFAGEQVVRAVLTGTFTSDPSLGPGEIDEQCAYCGGAVEMTYEREVISVRCTDCGGVLGRDFPEGSYVHYEFPPAGLAGRTPEEVVDAAHVLYDAKLAPMTKDVCPECAGRVGISYEVCDDHEVGESGLCPDCGARYEAWSVLECENCRYSRRSVVWFAPLNHPAVVAFLHDHGLDEPVPFRKLTGDNARFVRDVTGTVVGTDPYRFRVEVAVDDETLTVHVDEALDVTAVEREAD